MRPRRSRLNVLTALVGCLGCIGAATLSNVRAADDATPGVLKLTARDRVLDSSGAGRYDVRQRTLEWKPDQTAIIICDMWDLHHCKRAVDRVQEMAPRMNEVIAKAREMGVLIVHAPSSCMAPYENTPMRQRAKNAPAAKNLPKDIGDWCRQIPAEEQGKYPLDQSDGGEDDGAEEHAEWVAKLTALGRNPKAPWKTQYDVLKMDERDAVSDSGVEIWNLLEERGIDNVILMGVHTNMCVLGRPFGLRQMAKNGKNVVLMRDLTDTMYNPARWPYVSHFRGTDLIVEHIEKFVCPTITSDQLLGGAPLRFKADVRPRVVIAISEDEYKTNETLPRFAQDVIEDQLGFRAKVLHGDAKDPNVIPGLADSLGQADLLVVSIRRRALPEKDLAAVRKYVASGRPLVGIRTASHAFHTRGKTEPGQAEWQTFDPEVLGGNYTGHHGNDLKPRVTTNPGTESHSILTGVFGSFSSGGSLYKVSPLANGTTPLLTGTIPNQPAEPVAWTNMAGKSRVFYTSLGHIDDFKNPQFVRLLSNAVCWALDRPPEPQPLAGTKPLTLEGDIASQLVEGVDRFLLKRIDESVAGRSQHWKRDASSAEAYNKSLEPNRKRLAHVLGLRDPRVPFDGPELLASTAQPALVGKGAGYDVFAVRWPAFGDVHGEGLLLVPTGREKIADVIAIPDADQTPEQIVGLTEGVPAESQFARRLAESGCRVIVPVLIDRKLERRNGRANLTSREFVYRSAFELGRHLVGYEVQKVLAAADWFAKDSGNGDPKIGVVGYGEGGLLALCAGALDPRIDAVGVSGYFDDRRNVWQEPIDRNVFRLLQEFGDAELASMVSPRKLAIEAARGPELTLPSDGGAPARLVTPKLDDMRQEVDRTKKLAGPLAPGNRIELVSSGDGSGPFGTPAALQSVLAALASDAKLAPLGEPPEITRGRKPIDPQARHARQMHEIDRHNQWLLGESAYVRRDFMSKLDTSSLEKYSASVEPYREFFRKEVIGAFDEKPLSANPRTRKAYDTAKWTGYEVVLDVFPDVIAYGILLLPKDLKEGEKRPVVVCQHGLEGRPQDIITGDNPAYHDFAGKLADRGFITFAPQNLYIFRDRFRTLQRKANPLGKTLFSVIVPQHQQITDWLKTLPNVDPERIAFYGLSYGGKSAMRIPPLVSNYCLSICSADFNEWVWKNASSNPRNTYTYVWTGEYEIFEFDLGSTFNYAEMAALIAPRPFMVERGHFDGVAPDETVGYEFAKVFNLYDARLGIGDRCELEWFVGPHTINGKGTYDFLHKHLKWPKP